MGILAGYVVPHPPLAVHEVGRGDEEAIRDTLDSYRKVAEDIAKLRPDTIVITSPHTVMYRDYFHISPGTSAAGDFGAFRAPQVSMEVRYDTELASEIEHRCYLQGFPAGRRIISSQTRAAKLCLSPVRIILRPRPAYSSVPVPASDPGD